MSGMRQRDTDSHSASDRESRFRTSCCRMFVIPFEIAMNERLRTGRDIKKMYLIKIILKFRFCLKCFFIFIKA